MGERLDEETFKKICEEFAAAKDSAGEPLNMHYLAVESGGWQETASDPSDLGSHYLERAFGGKTGPSDVRSLSKTVLALIAGAVAARHDSFSEDTRVWEYLTGEAAASSVSEAAEGLSPSQVERWKNVKVKHLLSHTTGFDEVLLMRGDIEGRDLHQLVADVISTPLIHAPGDRYLYSNAGSYLLSVMLDTFLRTIGEIGLEEWADQNFFQPLGISDWHWEKYGDYLAGATRLWLKPRDLIQIGRMMLTSTDRSEPEAHKVWDWPVPRSWIEMLKTQTALTPQVDTPTNPAFRRYAYARGLWLGAKDGIFFGHGTGGQTLAMIPKKDAIVVTLADQDDVTRLEELVEKTIAAVDPQGG